MATMHTLATQVQCNTTKPMAAQHFCLLSTANGLNPQEVTSSEPGIRRTKRLAVVVQRLWTDGDAHWCFWTLWWPQGVPLNGQRLYGEEDFDMQLAHRVSNTHLLTEHLFDHQHSTSRSACQQRAPAGPSSVSTDAFEKNIQARIQPPVLAVQQCCIWSAPLAQHCPISSSCPCHMYKH